ncbi:MAG: Rab family GTPase [Promethearchaeota archaeon]
MDAGDKRKWAIKLTILGDAAVGKTSLIDKYITDSFKENYQPTLGVNIVTKDIRIKDNNSDVRLLLWDIAGQDKYELTRQMFFQGCTGSLLVYDMTRYSTFERIKTKWLKDFQKYGRQDGIYILIGNKSDLKDSIKVSSEEGELLSKEINAVEFIETSAKYGENVEKAFKSLVSHVLGKFGVKIDFE